MLVSGVVHHQCDRRGDARRGDLPQQLANRFGGDIRMVRHANQLMRYRVQRAEHVISLAARSSTHEHANRAPEPTQKRADHEVRGVHEKHRTFLGSGLGQSRLKLLILKTRPVFRRVLAL